MNSKQLTDVENDLLQAEIEENAAGFVLKDQNFDYLKRKSVLLKKKMINLSADDIKKIVQVLKNDC